MTNQVVKVAGQSVNIPEPPPVSLGPPGLAAAAKGAERNEMQANANNQLAGRRRRKYYGGQSIEIPPVQGTNGSPSNIHSQQMSTTKVLLDAEIGAVYDAKGHVKGGKRRTRKTKKSGKRKTRRNRRHRSKRRH